MVARIKKNDLVVVLTGKYKGKQGAVIEIYPKKSKILVKDVGLVTKHLKSKRGAESGGIKKQELPISISNVMPLCVACKKPCRVMRHVAEDGSVLRACNRCKEVF